MLPFAAIYALVTAVVPPIEVSIFQLWYVLCLAGAVACEWHAWRRYR